LYTSEIRVGQVFSTFTALAVGVACLGHFGLVTFAAGQRNREMRIRKVLGAGTRHIIVLTIGYQAIKSATTNPADSLRRNKKNVVAR